MYYNISQNPKKEYIITESGEHIFYFENISADVNFIIDAENAIVKIYGLYQGNDNDSFNLSINQIHSKPNSQSIALIKSILENKSHLNFTGRIRIEKNAKNSKAHLINKNILLDNTASATSIPQLEVLPHEVECTHAATTAPLDTDQIDYLIARGISRDNAQKLLINGFTNEVYRHKK